MKTYSFEMESQFGFFQWNKTKGDKRITNLFISKTDVLGVLGAIVGLDGYSQEYFKEVNNIEKGNTFYQALGGLRVSILPLSKPELFEDHLIHRRAHHINKKGSLMVYNYSLINPKYKIYFQQGEVNDDVFDNLIMYLSKGWAEYIPYAGKNTYPIDINKFKEEKLTEDVAEKHIINSLFLEENLQEDVMVFEIELKEDEMYHYIESLKFFREGAKTPDIEGRNMLWSSYEVSIEGPVFESVNGEKVVFY